ncbi:elongation factor P 5-aminopentanone reductase [Sediminibacillus massiliensis]|uniref:elongation factor P 5-aminopentanone reductase n=1 Tax=Sediminibacillus massiliensis TaxID=1926277 RepID=UPI0009887D33|nr:SDR family oxidoreductase [Sediminibacillus massiliensis]
MNKTCLVMGASGDIGKAVAIELVNEGYSLYLHYNNNREAIEDIADKESILGIIRGDLSNNEGIKGFLEKVQSPVDAVVFANGKSHFGLFQDVTDTNMDEMWSIHVKALWMVTRHCLPSMISRRRGKIVVVSSIWGDIGASCEVVYSSVKGAQNSFVKALAKELAPSGVSVNGVSPGFIDTKMNAHFSQEDRESIIEQIPANRAGRPEEVAHIVSFLLDDRSEYIQGQLLNINGAW